MSSDRWTPKRIQAWMEEHRDEVDEFTTRAMNRLHEELEDWAVEIAGDDYALRALSRVVLAGSIADAALDLRTWEAALASNLGMSKSTIAASAGLDPMSKIDRWPGFNELVEADQWNIDNAPKRAPAVQGRRIPITVAGYSFPD